MCLSQERTIDRLWSKFVFLKCAILAASNKRVAPRTCARDVKIKVDSSCSGLLIVCDVCCCSTASRCFGRLIDFLIFTDRRCPYTFSYLRRKIDYTPTFIQEQRHFRRRRWEGEGEEWERKIFALCKRAREHCCETFAMRGLTPAAYAAWLIKARQWAYLFSEPNARAARAQKETSAFLYEAPLCKFDARVRRIVNK